MAAPAAVSYDDDDDDADVDGEMGTPDDGGILSEHNRMLDTILVEEELLRGQLQELDYEAGSRFRFTPWLVQRLDRPLGRAGSRLAELLGRPR